MSPRLEDQNDDEAEDDEQEEQDAFPPPRITLVPVHMQTMPRRHRHQIFCNVSWREQCEVQKRRKEETEKRGERKEKQTNQEDVVAELIERRRPFANGQGIHPLEETGRRSKAAPIDKWAQADLLRECKSGSKRREGKG